MLYKGMDLPGRNEGCGRTGFIEDGRTAFQAKMGQLNQQTAPAEAAFLEIRNNPQVESMEVVGYSIGSLHMNYLAAKHDAVGTVIADMGMSNSVLTDIYNK